MSDTIKLEIWYNTEIVDGKTIYDFNFYGFPTDMIPHVVRALTYESLARAGIKYDQSAAEKQYSIRIDYFRALEQAVNAGKQLIEDDFSKERAKNNANYLDHCKKTGLTPTQIFIDFPNS